MEDKKSFKSFSLLSVLIIFLFFYIPSIAQDIIPTINDIKYGYNAFLKKDNNGFVWISSIKGIYRFDGHQTKYYSLDFDENVQSNFHEKSNGDIYTSTYTAIQKYNLKNDKFFAFQISYDNEKITSNYHIITIVKDRFLWLKADNAIYRLDLIDNPNNQAEKIVETKGVRFAVKKGKNNLIEKILACHWLNKSGLELITLDSSYTPQKETIDTFNYTLKQNIEVRDAVYHEDGNKFWLLTNMGLGYLSNSSSKGIEIIPFKKKINYDIYKWSNIINSELVIHFKDNGLWKFDLAEEKFSEDFFLPTNNNKNFYSIYRDSFNHYWLSQNGSTTINYFWQKENLQKFNFLADEKNSKITSITESKNGNIVCITNQLEIIIFNTDLKIIYRNLINEKNKNNTTNFISTDSLGNIWKIGSRKVEVFNLKTKKWNTIKIFPNTNLFSILHFTQKEKLISTSNGLFDLYIKNKKWEIKKSKFNPSSNNFNIVNMFEGKKYYLPQDDNLLKIIEKYSLKEYNIKMPSKIYGIYEDTINNKTWFATLEGLAFIDWQNKPQIEKINNDVLKNKPIFTITGSKSNNLWLSTDEGLIKYNPLTNQLVTFPKEENFKANNFSLYTATTAKDGKIWIGTKKGVLVFHPDSILAYQVKPKVVFNQMLINEHIIDTFLNPNELQKIQLKHNQNNLKFRVTSISYHLSHKNKIHFRLLGYDKNWNTVENGAEIKFISLLAGKYKLEIYSTNSNSIKGDTRFLTITILPPWYQTWWFRTLAALGIAGIIYLIYRNRIQQIQKEADFRRKEAEYKQLAAETETAVLRLQMNPHFIFNSMNSISSYLLQKDIETANDYLGRFARLMRKILMVAEQPYLSLYEEIELLEQYMQAEGMRFEEKFQYEFLVDEAIDTDDILVPTMILQPFVENAIWHGISNKKGLGEINIGFDIKDTKLICSITDNGIGRKAARQNSTNEHESKAISITQRRLNLLVAEHNLDFQPSLAIQDLTNATNQPIGTKVVLTLPLI